MTLAVVHPFLLKFLRGSDPVTVLSDAPRNGDWEEIIRDAAAQGLTPLLYRWLKSSGVSRELPGALADRLESQFVGLAARNMMLASELKSILQEFEKRQVPCAPLRGLALAEALYGDVTARPMGDIDLLVRKEDLPEVVTILRELGFREMDRRPGFAQAFYYTLKFVKDRHGWIIVEPHWSLAYPPFTQRLDMEQVWKRCQRGRVVGVETWVLGQEELLLNLCFHLTHHNGTAPLLWFYELHRLLRENQEALDWSRVVSLAREANVEFLLLQALNAVRALFTTPIPDRVLTELTREPRRSVEGRLTRLLAAAPGVDGKESLAVLFTLKGLRAKLRYAFTLLFPSPEFMLTQYELSDRRQLSFAYLRRFCYLFRQSFKGLLFLLSPLARTIHECDSSIERERLR